MDWYRGYLSFDEPFTVSQAIALQQNRLFPILPDDAAEEMEAGVTALMAATSPPFEEDIVKQAHVVVSLLNDNNSAPSNTQSDVLDAAIDHLDEQISQDMHDLATCQLQINSLLRNVSRLLEDRGEAQRRQNYLKAYRSPLRRLSPEVLAHIFSYTVTETIIPPKMPTIVAISQVCRAWRSASFGHSALWTSLSIVATTDMRPYIPLEYPLWDHMLQRLPGMMFIHAKNQPLQFSLWSEPGLFTLTPSCGILDSLFPFFRHLAHLRIRVSLAEQFATFLRLPSGLLPSLESLDLWIRPDSEPVDLKCSLFDSSPFLRSATLDLALEISIPSIFSFPWSQLITLKLVQWLEVPEWFTVFPRCTSLEVGHFKIIDHSVERSQLCFSRSTVWENLTTLSVQLGYHFINDMGAIEGRIHFPALCSLTLYSYDNKALINNFIFSFIGVPLRHLCLARVSIKLDILNEFLGSCDVLERLSLDLPNGHPRIFQTLQNGIVGSCTPAPTLPNLRLFTACISAHKDKKLAKCGQDTVEPLASLLQHWYLHSTLEHVHLFVQVKSRYKGGTQSNRTVATFIQDLKVDLDGCEVTNPRGFGLTVKSYNEYDNKSPIVEA
ncbi:hypothetical protein DXG03_004434 [Asterophora parasitica]|uniref:F-box domain-containing protein n=1 Tax=Asterophora parasitica TaxID=117018 RepID=A0A9P7G058_9AGAR|nr:hypothetical protein DXG03_004434 [Asterophora parasitica]